MDMRRLRVWHAVLRRAPGRRGFDDDARLAGVSGLPADPQVQGAARAALAGVANYAAWLARDPRHLCDAESVEALQRDVGELRYLLAGLDRVLECVRVDVTTTSNDEG